MMALSLFVHLLFVAFLLISRSWGIRPPVLQSYQVSLLSPSPSAATLAPGGPSRSAAQATPPRTQAPPPATPALRPVVSARAPKAEMKPDPERLQEWWKKASVKVPAIQPKPSAPATKELAKVDLTKRQTKVQPLQPAVPAAPFHDTAGSEKAVEKAALPDSMNPGQSGSAASPSSIIASGKASSNGPIFKFPSYLQNMENKISGQWIPPGLALHEEGAGTIIRFNVTKEGKIEAIEVEKSSGNNQFDQAAMRAVYAAAPLPPLPEGLNEDRLNVHFSFTLQKGS